MNYQLSHPLSLKNLMKTIRKKLPVSVHHYVIVIVHPTWPNLMKVVFSWHVSTNSRNPLTWETTYKWKNFILVNYTVQLQQRWTNSNHHLKAQATESHQRTFASLVTLHHIVHYNVSAWQIDIVLLINCHCSITVQIQMRTVKFLTSIHMILPEVWLLPCPKSSFPATCQTPIEPSTQAWLNWKYWYVVPPRILHNL